MFIKMPILVALRKGLEGQTCEKVEPHGLRPLAARRSVSARKRGFLRRRANFIKFLLTWSHKFKYILVVSYHPIKGGNDYDSERCVTAPRFSCHHGVGNRPSFSNQVYCEWLWLHLIG